MTTRDITAADVPTLAKPPGRLWIAVIGIDRYRNWPVLTNAVRDARGALALFEQLGFAQAAEPLFDAAATGTAITALVTDELMKLGRDDSLVLFVAGHGGTRIDKHDEKLKTGYLIPVDAAADGGKVSTWIELDDWLRKVARLPPRHILVLLDACYAGIALTSIVKWRDSGTIPGTPIPTLQGRRSRRIITSALDNEVARDTGPVAGHSLFTGCLIEGFRHGLLHSERGAVTGTELGLHLQQRVTSFPGSQQTPDVGAFESDQRGEIVIPLLPEAHGQVGVVRPSQTVSLAIATVPAPARSRRWMGAAAATAVLAAIVAAVWFVNASPSEPQPPVGAADLQDLQVTAVERDAAVEVDATSAPPSEPPPSVAKAEVVTPRKKASAPAPPKPTTSDAGVTKRRPRAPRPPVIKPAVDDRDCPIPGSYEVDIASVPKGATIYLNHKECGEYGKTPMRVKLAPSEGTRTGKFTVILEKAGEARVTDEFEVPKVRRLKRVFVRFPPKPRVSD